MGEHEEGRLENGQTVRWKRIEKKLVDAKKLKAEQPEIYKKYSNVSVYRMLSVAS